MRRPNLATSLVEALLTSVGCAAVALAVNALRPGGLPLIAQRPYETLVPCPEPGGPVTALEAGDPVVASEKTFVLDARGEQEYAAWHLPGASNVPYDYLDPLPGATMLELARAVAASGATRVVVYGDGDRPDSGEQLGREFSGRGIKNVCFVRGGAPALRLEVDR